MVRRAKPKRGVAPGRGGRAGGATVGQPPFVPTEVQRMTVQGLVSIGTEQWVIAEALKIPLRTLARHFTEELKNGRAVMHARIGGGIVAAALSGDKTMMIFYAKAQMGWRDRYNVGFDDEKGNPVNPSNLFTINIQG